MGGFEASNRLFDGLMNLLVLVAGALFMINGQIEPADLVAYMLYVGTLITSIGGWCSSPSSSSRA